MDSVKSILEGDRLGIARLLTQIENDTPEGRQALDALFPHTGQAHLIGVTGATGTGKSTLVNQIAYNYRHPPEGEEPKQVAIIAVDPTSPFSGGAVLGDRIRMRDLAGDPGVFIRSMASRGSLGGLAAATSGLVSVFDAAGFEIILIETVGAGQDEVDIARLAHTTLVVEAPGLGDDIQAIKAGILEIADILVVNKADRPGVETTERALRGMLQLAGSAQQAPRREPPILRTVATEGQGVPKLVDAIAEHRRYLLDSGQWEQSVRTRLVAELNELLQRTLVARWRATLSNGQYESVLEELVARRVSPQQAVRTLIAGDG
jgi:LAO/AO transport system kinase